MTSTSVKSVNSYYMNSGTNRASKDKNDALGNFTNILNEQIGGNNKGTETGYKPAVKSGNQNIKQTKANEKTESDVRKAESTQQNVRQTKEDGVVEITENDTVETVEEAFEEAVEEVVEAIAEELNVSTEEIKKVLEELGMTLMDLLQPQQLTQVVMTISGENDSMSLITNEDLYQVVQNLTEAVNNVWEQLEMQTGIPMEELRMMAEQQAALSEQPEVMPEQEMSEEIPKVEVTVIEADAIPLQETKEVLEEQPKDGKQPVEMQEDSEKVSTVTVENKTEEGSKDTKGETASRFGEKENQQFLFQNQTMTENATMKAATQNEVDGFFTTDTQQIMKQIMDFLKIQVRPGMSELQMQLHPESLGTLHVRIAAREGMMTAQFTAQNETVKAALESQMMQLKDSFQAQGIKVEHIEVTVASHGFERNLEQGRERNQQMGANKKKSSRRIDFADNDFLKEDEIQEEETATAQMMKANGNTVDYTA